MAEEKHKRDKLKGYEYRGDGVRQDFIETAKRIMREKKSLMKKLAEL